MKPDARGWYWHEKLRIVGAAWLLDIVILAYKFVCWATDYRINPYASERFGGFYLTLTAEAYLYGDLRRGDMPENNRIGGVWR